MIEDYFAGDRPHACTNTISAMHNNPTEALQRLIDRAEIYDVMCSYARAVDRGEWDLLRSTYHPDAHDDHVEYKGNIDGLIDCVGERFAGMDNSMHFLGNCLIEFAGPFFGNTPSTE